MRFTVKQCRSLHPRFVARHLLPSLPGPHYLIVKTCHKNRPEKVVVIVLLNYSMASVHRLTWDSDGALEPYRKPRCRSLVFLTSELRCTKGPSKRAVKFESQGQTSKPQPCSQAGWLGKRIAEAFFVTCSSWKPQAPPYLLLP